jgi:hypothetical protein
VSVELACFVAFASAFAFLAAAAAAAAALSRSRAFWAALFALASAAILASIRACRRSLPMAGAARTLEACAEG